MSEEIAAVGKKRPGRLFFTDLDETLLTTEKKVSHATYEALRTFTEAGNSLVIATGRSLHSALYVQKELGLDFPGSYILASNGCLIYDCDAKETLFRTGVPLPAAACSGIRTAGLFLSEFYSVTALSFIHFITVSSSMTGMPSSAAFRFLAEPDDTSLLMR